MQGNRSEGTKPEVAVRSAVQRLGLRFRKHRAPLRGLRCKADLVFPTERVAVFVDGCFWHGCPDHGKAPRTNAGYWSAKIAANLARDKRNNEALADAGWIALRAWEHERPEIVAWRVSLTVKSRRAKSPKGGDDG
jgi:DNA mismatch endonuclease, patch repair protein